MNEIKLPWMNETTLPWQTSSESYIVTVDFSVYSPEAVMKTCYLFLDQCYLFVEPKAEDKANVYFTPLNKSDDISSIIGEFSNRLLWQETRQRVSVETQVVRELIVAQAFSEVGILDNNLTEADYNLDPIGIGE